VVVGGRAALRSSTNLSDCVVVVVFVCQRSQRRVGRWSCWLRVLLFAGGGLGLGRGGAAPRSPPLCPV
jgi:hypothetical protein